MPDPLVLLIDLLAVYRLTRLVVKDSILDKPRHWILQRWPSELTTFPDDLVLDRHTSQGITIGSVGKNDVYLDEEGWKALYPHKLTELIECVYCASVWIAFGVLALRVWWDWWQYPAIALALAGGVALIFAKLDND